MKLRIITVIAVVLFGSVCLAADVKESDLAGSWYPSDGRQLSGMLGEYLKAANPEPIDGRIIALISPHAGYQYSGPIAAYGFKAIEGRGIKTVIVLGFSHRIFFDGISIYDKGSWRTPLGDVQIDEVLAKEIISKNPRVRFQPSLFMGENSVEMQIPFIQIALKDVKIVPMAFGTQDYKDAEALAKTLASVINGRKDILIVASTDMSHDHSYKDANMIDAHTIHLMEKMSAKSLYDEGAMRTSELCGLMPVTTVLLTASNLGYDKVKTLKYANSGDLFGENSRIVGYMSAVIYKEKKGDLPMLNADQRKRLLQIARESVTGYVKDGKRKSFKEDDPLLNEPLGAFVTLHDRGGLRGCIGNMVGRGPLYQTVADMAIEAGTADPRFSPLAASELDRIDIEISVLSPLKKVSNYKEVNIPGHGVIIRRGFASGVYLPQVATETGWSRDELLSSLCAHKAGLPADAWKDPATEIYVFTAEVFGEKGEAK